MSTVLAASYMNIPLAHTMGGEVTGTIDESVRYTLATKLSHIHFPATKNSYFMILKLEKRRKNVFQVDVLELTMLEIQYRKEDLTKKIVKLGVGKKIDFDNEFIILSYHPVTTEFAEIENNFKIVLNVIEKKQIPLFDLVA